MQGRYHEESCLHATGSRCVSLINVAERTLQLFFFFPLNGRHVEPRAINIASPACRDPADHPK